MNRSAVPRKGNAFEGLRRMDAPKGTEAAWKAIPLSSRNRNSFCSKELHSLYDEEYLIAEKALLLALL